MNDEQRENKPAKLLRAIDTVEIATENHFRTRVAALVQDEKWGRHHREIESISDPARKHAEILVSVRDSCYRYADLLSKTSLYYVCLYKYAVLMEASAPAQFKASRKSREIESEARREALRFVRRRFALDEHVQAFIGKLPFIGCDPALNIGQLQKSYADCLQGWEARAITGPLQLVNLPNGWEGRALTWAVPRSETLPLTTKTETPEPGAIVPDRLDLQQDNGAKTRLNFATSWTEIEVAFLSDERIEVCINGQRKTYNYGELGFEDRRDGKPSRAWVMLREIAGRNGTIPKPEAGKNRAAIQKRIEEIRERLRTHFKIEGDPVPFNGNAYQTSFKINRRPSFET